ncbi:MAG: ATP-dependent DNA helicase RecG [Alphaproteobacteria bacterium]|nr:ATP-dependent DNA helicase RecG [Alphaproteobacteria bacterium]
MRPEILFKLFTHNTELAGVGPRISNLLINLTGPNIADLLWLLPNNLIDRRVSPLIADAPDGKIATLTVTVVSHRPSAARRRPYRIDCVDETGKLELIYFNPRSDYLRDILPVNEKRVISGKIDIFNHQIQMTHPDHVVTEEKKNTICKIEPVYPLTQGLSGKVLRRIVAAAFEKTPDLPEWLDPNLIKREGWNSWKKSLEIVHNPQHSVDLEQQSKERMRLAYDELLANQLALSMIREHQKKRKGRPIMGSGALTSIVDKNLPFVLTLNQLQVLDEIKVDLTSNNRMLRLLQGDVGSGKTVVAFYAILTAIEAGYQTAFMAPTEILAKQHFQTLEPLAKVAGLNIDILTGKKKSKEKAQIIERLRSGETDLLIGTHALFQAGISFNKLGFAVVDEQHKFGVHQRLALSEKGEGVDILIMTATPIPRTLSMTAYGDLDVSILNSKLPGRKPVVTRAVSKERLSDVVAGIERVLSQGKKAYWVCPLIELSEKLDLGSAEERYKHLEKIFGNRVAMVHGRMNDEDKDAVMESFRSGTVDLLIATSVIEVGVDVPDATIMVIEHAERFGLAQLHQLRGRVGRGLEDSTCLLLYNAPLTKNARARINVLRESEDGFVIAEEDLKLRGSGEVLGVKQSGLPQFKIADLTFHSDLLELARNDAQVILNKDPNLTSKRGLALKTLLYLFERDSAVQYLKSG